MQVITKDITTVNRGVIAHGVNRKLAMNSGVAKAIVERWPEVKEEYLKQDPPLELGEIDPIQIRQTNGEELTIINCYTQETYGREGKHADLEAVKSCMKKALLFAAMNRFGLYIPQIGSGLGGLDWEQEVKPALEEIEREFYEKFPFCDRKIVQFIVCEHEGG